MAEYMDIMRIDDWNDLSILDDNGNARYVYDVGELPRAGVIEREKIEKAIEEIQKLRGCSCSCSDGIIDDVEDILDKLIESESEE